MDDCFTAGCLESDMKPMNQSNLLFIIKLLCAGGGAGGGPGGAGGGPGA